MNSFIAEIQGHSATLTSEESWHCAKVLRKKTGDLIRVIDGKGNYGDAQLELVSEKKSTARLVRDIQVQPPRNYHFHLAIAPTKQVDRVEWMVEKMVEIGVDEISFLNCRNSERKVLKTERIKKIVESAVKQSLQARLPQVHEMMSFKDFVSAPFSGQKLIAYCSDGDKQDIKEVKFKDTSTLVLIGPEGDFSPEEVDLALKNGFKALSLGHNRLRSETAGLYVCQAAALL